mmetsp:Transcript_3329/g.10223  ORF Transcript_3329/g.10223 Transcript_3329/m.10223 type:complete len:322 (+) Transcript_3329:823-1788(+)
MVMNVSPLLVLSTSPTHQPTSTTSTHSGMHINATLCNRSGGRGGHELECRRRIASAGKEPLGLGTVHAGGVGRFVSDATHVLPFGEPQVPRLPPLGPPLIPQLPVRLSIILAVPDKQKCMVERCATVKIEHAVLVELELALVGLDGHSDGLAGRGHLECRLVAAGNAGIRVNADGGFARGVAAAVAGNVRVAIGGAQWVPLCDVLERSGHEAALTPVVRAGVAVHELGYRQPDRALLHLDGVARLDRTHRRDGPRSPALSLVHNRSDPTGGLPVDRRRRQEHFTCRRNCRTEGLCTRSAPGEECCKLCGREVGELVVPDGE